jgi:hypothetical protein
MPWTVSHLFLIFNRLSVKPYSTEAGNVKGVGFDLPRLVLPLCAAAIRLLTLLISLCEVVSSGTTR